MILKYVICNNIFVIKEKNANQREYHHLDLSQKDFAIKNKDIRLEEIIEERIIIKNSTQNCGT